MQLTDPVERIRALISRFLFGELPPDIVEGLPPAVDRANLELDDPLIALIEVRVQAIHDAEYKDRIGRIDRAVRDQFAADIAEGIERGSIREADPEEAAETLYTLLIGGLLRRTTTDVELETVRDDAYEFVDQSLVVDTDS